MNKSYIGIIKIYLTLSNQFGYCYNRSDYICYLKVMIINYGKSFKLAKMWHTRVFVEYQQYIYKCKNSVKIHHRKQDQ